MNKKRIVECVGSHHKGLNVSRNSIFRVHDGLILHGIHLEWVPRGLYLWRLMFPLFDNRPLHLSFSKRVGANGGFVPTDGKTDQAICSEILASPVGEFIRDGTPPVGLDEFVNRLQASPALGNPHVRMMFAAALVLKEDDVSALQNLQSIEGYVHPSDDSDYSRLLKALTSSRDEAIEVLCDFVSKSSRSLGLVGIAR